MLRINPPGEDGLERAAERAAVPADDRPEQKPDYLHLVALAEQQAASYVQQVSRKSWTRNYRAFHNQHFADSKYLHKDWARRSKIFVPKTRSAVRLFQKQAGLPADGHPTNDVIARLQQTAR